MYLLSNLQVKYGQIPAFSVPMTVIRDRLEAEGWKLVGAYQAVVGSYTAVTHVWEVQSADHMTNSLAEVSQEPAIVAAVASLAEYVTEEITQLVVPTPYSPAGS